MALFYVTTAERMDIIINYQRVKILILITPIRQNVLPTSLHIIYYILISTNESLGSIIRPYQQQSLSSNVRFVEAAYKFALQCIIFSCDEPGSLVF